jgi:hypothetical protein
MIVSLCVVGKTFAIRVPMRTLRIASILDG